MRSAFVVAFLALFSGLACQSTPAVTAPVVASEGDASARLSPAPSSPSPAPSSPFLTADKFEAAINAGDEAAARALSTNACWDKECASFSSQAQRKFKVKRVGDPKVQRLHAALELDVLCEGTRHCDKVWVLFALDCARGGAPGEWRAEDVTESQKKVRAWIDDAPSACQ